MKVVESLVKEDTANFKEFGYLQTTHYNAWKGKDVQPILAGKPDFKSTGKYFYYILLIFKGAIPYPFICQ